MGEDQIVSVSLSISGKVQGVFYRASTKEQARLLGLSGFVKNKADGSVYAECSGPIHKVEELIKWCWEGPKMAVVENVIVEELKHSHQGRFTIAYL